MIEEFDIPTKGRKLTPRGRRKAIMHLLITGKILRFPEQFKDEVMEAVHEMWERHKKYPAGKITFYQQVPKTHQ